MSEESRGQVFEERKPLPPPRRFKVTLDGDEDNAIGNVSFWSVSGDTLVLTFPDGSVRGLRGFVEFDIEEDES